MKSTMQREPLTVTRILRHAGAVHPHSEVITATETGTRRAELATVVRRAAQLANALHSLGVDGDQRVATFMWNNQEHLEAYLAVPSMGAVLHTLNIRLSPDQLASIMRHADDRVVLVDDCLVAALQPVLAGLAQVEHVVVCGPNAADSVALLAGLACGVHRYEELLHTASDRFAWPDVDEDDAAALCYTSGTTGGPKGVAYSHRSIYLHSMAIAMGDGMRITTQDRVLPIVPMFHANAWGMPYGALLVGAALMLPDRFMSAEQIVRFIERTHPTLAAGVPTVWSDVVAHIKRTGGDLSSLRVIIGGGAPVSASLQRAMQDVCGVLMIQAWGMTETSPTAVVGWPPTDVTEDSMWHYRAKQGRFMSLVEARVVGESGQVLPSDGDSVGEIEVRGPYVTSAYHLHTESRHGGWLPTGDIGTIDPQGYLAITDRAKDLIKSGGEWISSVELEVAISSSPAVREAAVIGMPDPRWQERPLALVVLEEGQTVTANELREYLMSSFARWQVPNAWTFVDAIPRTSVGKFDKKQMRDRQRANEYDIVDAD
jgi:fatty-acyl-CoA synthase